MAKYFSEKIYSIAVEDPFGVCASLSSVAIWIFIIIGCQPRRQEIFQGLICIFTFGLSLEADATRENGV